VIQIDTGSSTPHHLDPAHLLIALSSSESASEYHQNLSNVELTRYVVVLLSKMVLRTLNCHFNRRLKEFWIATLYLSKFSTNAL
jgi:hypothetical protein